ncbi:hypothetical protein BHM03_00056271 [Ensete ventricosum]|nr:hypothetical protein BHM03_00056271 [Ensete ventricosum]
MESNSCTWISLVNLVITIIEDSVYHLVLQFGSHSKKRPNNLVLGRMFDHHIYDLVEVGVENFRPIESFEYDKKLTPRIGSKPFFAFVGEGFESVEELKHLKEVLLDLFRGEVRSLSFSLVQVVENFNLAGIDRVFVCTALSSSTVFLTHCALRLKRSGTAIPRMGLIEVGPSMDLVVRRHRLPNDSLKKVAMKTTSEQPKKKVCATAMLSSDAANTIYYVNSWISCSWLSIYLTFSRLIVIFLQIKNVSSDVLQGKIGKIYIPDQKVRVFYSLVLLGFKIVSILKNGYVSLFKVGGITLSSDIKGLKRERHEAKKRKVGIENEAKKRKTASD